MKIMKTNMMVLIFCLGFLNSVLAQVITEEKSQTPQELYDFHIHKKKVNKTAAWITLGGGVAMIIGGYGINMDQPYLGSSDDNNKGLWLSYLGGAVTLASIPLFIAGGKHKKKAKIQLQNGAVGFSQKVNYSGVSIVFSF